ncbi:MAG: recombinase family protein [Synergistaceae bacterium]|nr:recombinase family protein [Synergistaceae bacterium]
MRKIINEQPNTGKINGKNSKNNDSVHSKLRVAAYCRVSTDMEEQLTSFATQIKTYTERITSNPEWELAGIYADEGISGTSAEKRPKFKQMIDDCEHGKIDLILTKSISRFARNTLECLTYARRIQDAGAHICFENDGIDTRSGTSKMLFTLLAGFAEEESRSISENVKWGIRKRFESGKAKWSKLYGYRRKNEKKDEIEAFLAAYGSNGNNTSCNGNNYGSINSLETLQAVAALERPLQTSSASINTELVGTETTAWTAETITPHFNFLGGEKLPEIDPLIDPLLNYNATDSADTDNGGKPSGRKRRKNAKKTGGTAVMAGMETSSTDLFCDEYEIVPAEAAVVQRIFYLYEHGHSIEDICKYLTKNKIPTPSGKAVWYKQAVKDILTNERYAGDIQLQKFYKLDHLHHQKVKNDCTSIASYYIENHHRPIVSHKQFKRVQEILGLKNKQTGGYQYPFGDKLRCPYCKATLHQKTITVQRRNEKGWFCDDNVRSQSQQENRPQQENTTVLTYAGKVHRTVGADRIDETADGCCHNFIMPSALVETAVLTAYEQLEPEIIAAKLQKPKFKKAAEKMLAIKKKQPKFTKVHYWWVDDLIDHIDFGRHSYKETEVQQMRANGDEFIDDRVVRVYWRCGIVSTVPSGVARDKDDPQFIADLYREQIKRREAKEIATAALNDILTQSPKSTKSDPEDMKP